MNTLLNIFFKACSNFWGFNDGFLSHSQRQSQEVAGHYYYLWASDFNLFPNFGQIKNVCYCYFADFGQATIVIYTKFGQVKHLFTRGKSRFGHIYWRNLATFTEEILYGKLRFLCRVTT